MFAATLLMALIAADEPKADAEATAKVNPIRKFYADTAARYEFIRDREKNERLTLVTTPVFKWSTDDDWSGDVFVWTHAGRPEVIGCILSGPKPQGGREAYHEFHLLGEKPIAEGRMLSKFVWTPTEGLPTQPVEDAPMPADTPAQRLAQMRQIMDEFSAYMEANGKWELRLLTRPLMRYQPVDSDIVDGALFTYIWPKGTDPELLMLLECRKTKAGVEWRFAPARFSTREMWLKRDGNEIWRCPNVAGGNNSNPKKPYVTEPFGAVPPLDSEATSTTDKK